MNHSILLENLPQLHTTLLGVERIKRNLPFQVDNVVTWCKDKIEKPDAAIERKGKNWYILIDHCVITVNASSYTIITVHPM